MKEPIAVRARMLYYDPAFYRLVLIIQNAGNAGLREHAAEALLNQAPLPHEGH